MSMFNLNFEHQLETARLLCEADGRKVLIVGIATDGPEQGLLGRSASAGPTKKDARTFIRALEREIARIKQLMGEPA